MADDEPDGIQLRGKQLVFQAMSAIVVAVGVFLLGVMVGRGVPTARQPAALVAQEEVDPLVPSPAIPLEDALPIGQDDGTGSNPTYQDELVSDGAPKGERVKAASARPQPFALETAVATAPVASDRRALETSAAPSSRTVERTAEKTAAKPAASGAGKDKPVTSNAAVTGTSASSASGFLVQVAAYQREGEADAVRARLVSKGYPAFVTSASTTAGTFYRVRVGGYDKEADARSVAARLKREEHLEPWVTR
jgi:cell division septation protein DedD